MRMHNTSLSNELVDFLQDLTRMNIDSCAGFRAAADEIDDAETTACFKQLAHDRQRQSQELQAIVSANAEEPCESGSEQSDQRICTDLRSLIPQGLRAVLDEAERSEDELRDRYRDALQQSRDTPVAELLDRHYQAVCEAHDRVRDLRDSVVN